MLQKYNPRRIVGSFTGKVAGRDFAVQFEGFADDMIEASYDEARVTKTTGPRGDTAFTINASTATKLKVVFMQGSPTNTELSKLIPDAARNYLPCGTLSFSDLNGNSVYHTDEAVIETPAGLGFKKDQSPREWNFTCGQTTMLIGEAGDF